jgi:ABC-type branched-subunit amino acid transport system ATPase component
MRRARAGLSRSFQSLELFEEMTIEENIRAACEKARHRSYLTELFRPTRPALTPAAWAALREFDLLGDLSSYPRQLPYSRRRLVAIARAVAALPSILMLDEPAGGLDEHERHELGALVRRLADEWKIGVLVVEHDVELIMEICDRVSVLQFGKVIASGLPQEIRSHPEVIAAYIGGSDEPSAEDVAL